jgi:diketogulonate reductase-like aldo/keto reductase
VPPAQVAIAWLLAQRRPQVIPVVGARSAAQLEESLGATSLELTPEELASLGAAGAPALGFPRSFLESDNVRKLIYGDTWELIEAR